MTHPTYQILRELPTPSTSFRGSLRWQHTPKRGMRWPTKRGYARRCAAATRRPGNKCSALGESQKLAKWLGHDPPLLDRTQAREAFLDILRSQIEIRGLNDDFGRVRVLSAASAGT